MGSFTLFGKTTRQINTGKHVEAVRYFFVVALHN